MVSITHGAPEAEDSASVDWPPVRRSWYLAVVLMLALMFSHIDRSLLALMTEPIRASLGLSDSEIGLLHAAFGIFSGVAAFPLARAIDAGPRKLVVGAGLLLWTGATALTAWAGSFAQLFVARSAVSIGEAALMPGATSMLADSFPPEKRGKPMAMFTAGIYLGSAGALIGGGILLQAFTDLRLPLIPGTSEPWQSVFLAIGLLGMGTLPLLLVVREPVRRSEGRGDESLPSIATMLKFAACHARLLAGHMLGFTMFGFAANSVGAWTPALFMRDFGWSAQDLGLAFGIVLLVVGPAGGITGGAISDRLAKRGRVESPILVGIISSFFALPLALLAGLVESGMACMAALAGFFFFISFNWGLAVTSLAAIVPNRMRAQAVAVYIAISNVIGGGIGPLALALVADAVSKSSGGIQTSILLLVPASVAAGGLLLWFAREPFASMSTALPTNSSANVQKHLAH